MELGLICDVSNGNLSNVVLGMTEGRAVVNEYFGHYVIHAFDGYVQSLVVSPTLN